MSQRTIPSYVPVVGMRLRRNRGERAGQTYTVTEVEQRDNEGETLYTLRGNYEGGPRDTLGYAEYYDPIVELQPAPMGLTPAPAAFAVGQEVIVSARVNGVRNRNCEIAGGHIGQRATIDRIDPDGLIHYRWPGHGWQLLSEYLDAVDAPVVVAPLVASRPLVIGDEVEIVGPEETIVAIGAPAAHVGHVGRIVEGPLTDRGYDGGIRFRVETARGVRYWYPITNLVRAGEAGASSAPLSFDAAWRIARSNVNLPTMLEPLWQYITMPAELLSRQKADWNGLLICRAVLRLRRQFPNNVEEQLAKGRPYTQSVLATRVWQAASQNSR